MMGVTKLTTNGFTGLQKYDSFLAGNGPVLGGAFESIATTTVGSGGSSSITFSSIPTTFTHLQFRIMAKSSGLVNPLMTFNGAGGSSYSNHYLSGNGTAASSGAFAPYSVMTLPALDPGQPGCIIVDILDAFNTNKYKTVRALGGTDLNGSGYVQYFSCLYMSTSAISSINFSGTTFAQYSSFALYGVS